MSIEERIRGQFAESIQTKQAAAEAMAEPIAAAVRAMPNLVPATPDDPAAGANRAAWEALRSFDKPFLCAYSDGDPITRGADALFLAEVPGAKGRPHTTIAGGGHFLQEDRGPELAAVVADFVRTTPAED